MMMVNESFIAVDASECDGSWWLILLIKAKNGFSWLSRAIHVQ